jgi:hypothetical protein
MPACGGGLGAQLGNHDNLGDPNAQMSAYVQQRDNRWHAGYFYVKVFSGSANGEDVTVEVAFIDTSPWCEPRSAFGHARFCRTLSEG